MDTRWTTEIADDLEALARLARMQPITPAAYAAASYPSEEDEYQQHVDRSEGETDDWFVDDETLPLFGDQWQENAVMSNAFWYATMAATPPAPPDWVGVDGGPQAIWPAIKTAVFGFLCRWPRNAPLLS